MKNSKTLQELPDELNQDYIFSLTANELLVKIANGEIDAVELAKIQLSNRGLNENGEWVGFK